MRRSGDPPAGRGCAGHCVRCSETAVAPAGPRTRTFTIPAGVGPIGPVPVTVSTTDGKQFKTNTAVTFPAGPATLVGVPATAALAGSAYNVGAGNISQLVSPNVLGITVANPAAATGGFDTEPDQRYAQRLSNKWGTLATGSTEAAYIYWALTASRNVRSPQRKMSIYRFI